MSAPVDDLFDEAAKRLVSVLVRNAALRYRRQPSLLGMISGALDQFSPPRAIIAVCESLQENAPQPRMVGFSGTVQPVNLAGAILYARWRLGEAVLVNADELERAHA